MIVIIAEKAGACYGVNRALDLVKEANDGTASVHTLGPLIHNPGVVAELEESGISVADSIDEIEEGTVVIRSHGVPPKIITDAKDAGLTVVDATCPYVKKVQKSAQRLQKEGYRVVIVGEEGHPEVEAIYAHTDDEALIIGTPEELEAVPDSEFEQRVGIVVQTTQSFELLNNVVSKALQHATELRVYNTICEATAERQAAAADLAQRAEVMIVIGGKNSGNTRRLAEICKSHCDKTYHIESAQELKAEWFDGVEVVGITAGASTPASQISEVADAITEYE